MSAGLIGGRIGGAIGLAGGLFGASRSYCASRGPRERRFVICVVVALLVFIAAFLALLFLFPRHRPLIFVPYLLVLPVIIILVNRRQLGIRSEEQTIAAVNAKPLQRL